LLQSHGDDTNRDVCNGSCSDKAHWHKDEWHFSLTGRTCLANNGYCMKTIALPN